VTGELRRRRTDGARILLVEDNEDFGLLMDLALREAGYIVDRASCAEDALRMMQTQRYRLLLSDYSLPGHSGLWLLARVLERKLMIPGTALIVTGDPEAPGLDETLRVIPKPVNFDHFLSRIRTLLEGSSTDDVSAVAA
jgi:DNA-binding response OmpR family regulator